MIIKSKRADNIVEMIVITIAVVVVLNLVLGKVYDNFKDTIANSKYSKLFRSNQTSFEPSSGVNYSNPDSQINVPLVGEQGLTRYRSGAERTITSLWDPSNPQSLLDNPVAQKNLAEAATVLRVINQRFDGNSDYYYPFVSPSPASFLMQNSIAVQEYKTVISTENYSYSACIPPQTNAAALSDADKIKELACVKAVFHNNR